jgi:hypothetical protein
LKWRCTQKYRSQPSKCHRLKGPLMADFVEKLSGAAVSVY